jgi:hypothetical protein
MIYHTGKKLMVLYRRNKKWREREKKEIDERVRDSDGQKSLLFVRSFLHLLLSFFLFSI